MINNKYVLSSLSMDLKRIALAYHRGSDKVAERFLTETKRWIEEIDNDNIPNYIIEIINSIKTMNNSSKENIAEDALMYSTLLQNYLMRQE